MRSLVFAALLPLAACGNVFDSDGPGIAPQGTGSTRTFAAAGFTEVEAAGPDDVTVTVGPAFAVRAEGDPAVLDKLRVEVEDGELHVRRRRGMDTGSAKARIFVSLPAIRGAVLAGSGNMSIDRVTGDSFEGAIAGSGALRLAALSLDKAELSIAGSGDLAAAGTVRSLEINIAGSGDVAAPALKAARAEVSIAGSGGVKLAVDGPAEVNIMGSGDVDLGPNARCETNKMGSGSVRCGA